MSPQIIKVYADTSVYGGTEDDEFRDASTRFFEDVGAGRFLLCISAIVEAELSDAPALVVTRFEKHRSHALLLEVTEQVLTLQNEYIRAGIVSPKWEADALHVALCNNRYV